MSKANPILTEAEALDWRIEALSGDDTQIGHIEPTTFETTVYTLHLGDTVTTSHGNSTFERDPDVTGLCNFELSLGPANSRRLINFLLSLPDEPGHEHEGDDRDVKPAEMMIAIDPGLPVLEQGLHFEPVQWRAKVEGNNRYEIDLFVDRFGGYFRNGEDFESLAKADGDVFVTTLEDAVELCREHHAKRLAGGHNV